MAGQQDYLPSFRHGFARSAAESEYPELWRGLVGAWAPLLGVTGERLWDWSGRRRTAVNNSPYVTWRSSERGTALYGVAGTGPNSITIPAWTTETQFSIAIAAKLDTVSAGQQPIATDGRTGTSYGLFVNINNLYWIDNFGGSFTSSPSGLVTAGNWGLFGLSARTSASPSSGTGTFWINGVACGSGTVFSLDIVRIVREADRTLRGLVSFVGFWKRPLVAAEWQRLRSEPYSLFVPRRPTYGSTSVRSRVPYRRVLASVYGVSA